MSRDDIPVFWQQVCKDYVHLISSEKSELKVSNFAWEFVHTLDDSLKYENLLEKWKNTLLHIEL